MVLFGKTKVVTKDYMLNIVSYTRHADSIRGNSACQT